MEIIPLIVFIPILAAIGYFDFKKNIIPNKITYPAAVLAIVLNIAFSPMPATYIFAGGFASFVFGFVLGRAAAIGGGDLKLLILVGLMFGYPWFLAPLFGGFALGGLIMLAKWMAKKQKRDGEAVGIYLASSSIVVLAWLIFINVLG